MKLSKFITLGLILLAFALRAYRLNFQSYWIDEGWTVYFARLSPAELWHLLQVTEIMPPFYHPSTIYWVKLVGDSEYALRFYSLVFGVMAVAFGYRLGRDLGGRRLGWVLALLLAVSPYQIWHSQEARMYRILTAAAAMSMWGFVNIWQRDGFRLGLNQNWRWWLVYLVGTEWAIMTHYHGAVLIGSQGLFLLLTWKRHWRGYLRWAGSLVVMLLLYLPWLIFGGNLLQSYVNWVVQPTLWDSYLRSAMAYSVGELMPRTQAIPLTLVFVAVYLTGLVYASFYPWRNRRSSEMLAFLVACTLAPNLAAWLYGEYRTVVYLERYMIATQVGFLLTVAIGVLAIAAKLPLIIARIIPQKYRLLFTPLPLLLLVGINGWALIHHYFDPRYAKENWRGVVKAIEAFGQPGDAILLTGDGGENLFNFYYHGDLPVYASFNLLPPTHPDYKKARPGVSAMDEILTDLSRRYRRLWYTPYGSDIDARIEPWLAANTYPAWHNWLGNKRLGLYAAPVKLNRQETLNAGFSNQGPTLVKATLPNAATPAGDVLPLNLTWQIGVALSRNYQLSLRLVNGTHLFAQSDWPPLPTSTWPVNQPITDRRGLWLPPDLPPSPHYSLQLVVYDPSTGQPVGQPVTISGVNVGPAKIVVPLEALSIPNQTDQPFGSMKLVGYALPEKIRPGEVMPFTLYFQAPHIPGASFFFSLTGGDVKDTILIDPVDKLYLPQDNWQTGQVRRFVYQLQTSPRLSGKQATFEISLIAPSSNDTLAKITLPPIQLESRPRQFKAPAIAHPLNLTLGPIKLIGCDLPKTDLSAGDALPVTFYWQAGGEMDDDYIVFVQLLNSAGQVVTQQDLPPQAGAAPTTTWLPGEIIADPYTLNLPANLPPGDYRLITGLYQAANGQRLAVSSGGNFVELQVITVK